MSCVLLFARFARSASTQASAGSCWQQRVALSEPTLAGCLNRPHSLTVSPHHYRSLHQQVEIMMALEEKFEITLDEEGE